MIPKKIICLKTQAIIQNQKIYGPYWKGPVWTNCKCDYCKAENEYGVTAA